MNYILTFSLGILTWPVLEYVLHRFLGHVFKANTLFKKEHSRHHAETNYFAPLKYKLLASIPICTVTIFLVSLITSSFLFGAIYTLGFIGMYAFYEWVHWSFHARAPKTKIGMNLRKHHFSHHFHNPKFNHGVTTTFMDRITGTYMKVEKVKVPKNIPLPWLFDKDTNQILSQYEDDFQLK
jgi:sterol desaturase/sphingolipid hydroxylase (fatty acid hydroxylase superfamily)